MPGIEDHEFQTPEPFNAEVARHPRRIQPFVVALIALVVVAAGAYVWLRRTPAPAEPPAAAAAPAPPPAAQPVESAPRYDVPALADSDPFMRDRAGELSSHALVAAWARGTGLARNVAVVVDNLSRGLSPSQHLRVWRPGGSFRIIERGNRVTLDPRNYERFNPIAGAVMSIDPDLAARVYTGIKPLLQMAYDELGNQEPIDRAVERAVRQVLGAPVVDGDIALDAGGKGIGYRFANPSLESLPGAQKQLIRMGAANQRLIQTRVRQFAAAAQIPTGQ